MQETRFFLEKGEVVGGQKFQNFSQSDFFPNIFLRSDWLVQVSHEI